MEYVLFTATVLCFLEASSVPISISGRSWNRNVPDRVFTPIGSTAVQTANKPGSLTNKWQSVAVPAAFVDPQNQQSQVITTCNCPKAHGWTSEEITEHKIRTNISVLPFDCMCYGPDGYFREFRLPPLKEFQNCECPSSYGWSTEQFEAQKIRTNLTGNVHDCFCFDQNGFYIAPNSMIVYNNQEPPHSDLPQDVFGNNASNGDLNSECYCPRQNGWSAEQLQVLQNYTDFSGGSIDCFCSYDFSFLSYIQDLLEKANMQNTSVTNVEPQLTTSLEHQVDTQKLNDECSCSGCSYQSQQIKLQKSEGTICSCIGCASNGQIQQPKSEAETHLVVLTVDGPIKEFRLGPLWIRL